MSVLVQDMVVLCVAMIDHIYGMSAKTVKYAKGWWVSVGALASCHERSEPGIDETGFLPFLLLVFHWPQGYVLWPGVFQV